ncbi:TLC domain-containing protein, partial [Calycina marina]
MLDPFFSSPPILVSAIQPTADYLGLSTLPLHIHEVILGWTCYHLIDTIVSPAVSTWIFPSVYPRLPARTMISWNTHVTSFIQSCFITAFALFVIWKDEERKEMDWAGRIWGYTGAGGAVQGFAAGYFLWDLIASIIHLNVLGWGSLAHAVSALLVTSLGFRPFANYYGLNFILYELSTPFLNIHWFFDKLNMTGSRVQLYNGIVLLATFLSCRVLWGNYQSIKIYSDVWTALHTQTLDLPVSGNSAFAQRGSTLGLGTGENFGTMSLPTWLVIAYLGSNTVLNFLNVYWFAKMIQALMKRFRSPNLTSKMGKRSFETDVGCHI